MAEVRWKKSDGSRKMEEGMKDFARGRKEGKWKKIDVKMEVGRSPVEVGRRKRQKQ